MVAASAPWSVLASVNLDRTPRIPWSIPVIAFYLAGLLTYLNGSGPPVSTKASRKKSLRLRWINKSEWGWSLTAGVLGVLALWLTYAALGNLNGPPPVGREVAAMPLWALISAVVASAAVTAIAEEAGLRGYMQTPIEERYGAVAAIALSTIVFVMVHLSHGLGPLLRNGSYYAAAGCVCGVLAYFTRSILPSLFLLWSLRRARGTDE